MNDEILKLVKKCGDWNGQTVEMNDVGIEAFYRAAFNAGLEAAAKRTEAWVDTKMIAAAIRALEMK